LLGIVASKLFEERSAKMSTSRVFESRIAPTRIGVVIVISVWVVLIAFEVFALFQTGNSYGRCEAYKEEHFLEQREQDWFCLAFLGGAVLYAWYKMYSDRLS